MAETNIQVFPGDVEVASTFTTSNVNFTGSIFKNGVTYIASPWEMTDDHLTYTAGNVAIGTTDTSHANLTVGGRMRLTSNDDSNIGVNMSMLRLDFSESDLIQNLTSSDVAEGDFFGNSVAIYGNTLVVGAAYGAREGTLHRGVAYVFTRDTPDNLSSPWSQSAKLTPDDAGTRFGHGVKIEGDMIAVSAPQFDGRNGRIYIFVRASPGVWIQVAAFSVSSNPRWAYNGSGSFFGDSFSLSGDTMVVGAPTTYIGDEDGPGDIAAYDVGAAYVFTRDIAGLLSSTWSQVHIFDNPTIVGDIGEVESLSPNFFGRSVSVDGDTVVISALGKSTGNSEWTASPAAAYVYTRDTAGDLTSSWSLVDTLIANDAGAQVGSFGWSVSVSGDTVLVGAINENSGRGAVYVYTRDTAGDLTSTWTQTNKLVASDRAENDKFGYYISETSNETIAITNNVGNVYIFGRLTSGDDTSWSQLDKVTVGSDGFGNFAASIDPLNYNVLAVGTPLNDDEADDAGAVRVISKGPKLALSSGIIANGTFLSFTGQHLCFPEGPIEPGLIVSANKNKFMNLNGPLTTGFDAIKSSESLPIVSLSNVVNDPTVFGVVDGVEKVGRERRQGRSAYMVKNDKELGDNRVIVNSLGEGAMWVVNTNGNLLSGDYITTSNISGYGHKQDDDFLHSYTVAKITMDCDFSPEDIPIQVIKKDENGANILDEYDRLQWEDTDNTKKAYKIKNLSAEDDSNTVWTAAYVGCTYHCG